jgi:hypothetical protein
MAALTQKKDFGRRLIVSIVDEQARTDPEHVVYRLPLTRNVHDGFRDISAAQLANAVDRTAWWLESQLGKGEKFPTVGYMGPRMSRDHDTTALGTT